MHLYPMQRILVCTDFSDSSNLALKAAEELRQRNQGSIHLLHVSELSLELNHVLTEPATYRDHILGGLKKLLEDKMDLQILNCKATATPLIKSGNIIEVIKQLSDEGMYDLVVMGHGRSPIMSQLIGSTAYKMISSTLLPLLLVKTPIKFGRVVGLIDESRPKDKLIIATYNFFEKFKLQEVGFISLWMDFPEPFGNQQGAVELRDDLTREITHYCPPQVKPDIKIEPNRELKLAVPLNKILKETKADIAVLKKFTDGNLKRVYIGSTTKKLLEIYDGNLLIIPPTSHND